MMYFPLIISILLVEYYLIKFKKNYIGLHLLNIIYLCIYGLGGLFSIYWFEKDQIIYSSLHREDSILIISQVLVFFSYIFSLFGYSLIFKIKAGKNIKEKLFFNEQDIAFSSKVSLILCALFVLIYVSQYGGLFSALTYAAVIRSGYFEIEQNSKITFVKYLMPIGVFPFLYYGHQLILRKGFYNLIMFIISSGIVFLAFLLMSGRTRIVMYLFAFMLMYFLISKERINFKKLCSYVLIFFLSGFFIQFGKKFFLYFSNIVEEEKISFIVSNPEQETVFESFFSYFTHRTYSIEAALTYVSDTNNLYWFKDNLNMFLFLIPERLTGISKPDSISFLNTQLIMGEYDSTVPPGILAYGVYSLWIPGMFLSALCYGIVFSYLDKYYLVNKKNTLSLVFIIPCLFIWAMYGSVGDFRIIINCCIYVLLFMVVMIISKLFRSVKT